jgi:hypothetical protein
MTFNKMGDVCSITLRHIGITIFAMEKQRLLIIWVCVCILAIIIQHEIYISFFVPYYMLPVTCLAVPYFSILSHKQHSSHGEVTDYKMCFLIFSKIVSENSLILRRIQQEIITNLHQSSCNHVKYLLLLSEFNQTLIFLTIFEKS